MGILVTDGDTNWQEDEAGQILHILCTAYPGHPWAVRVSQGVIFIRHLQYPGNWGMNVKFNDVSFDAAAMKREVIMRAGEWLERAGLVRGRENGDEIVRVEGVPTNGAARHNPAPLIGEHNDTKVTEH